MLTIAIPTPLHRPIDSDRDLRHHQVKHQPRNDKHHNTKITNSHTQEQRQTCCADGVHLDERRGSECECDEDEEEKRGVGGLECEEEDEREDGLGYV